MQTILGANGTIGADLAKELPQYTDHIRLVSRNPKKVNANDELFPADLTDYKNVEEAVKGSKVVYLLVGFDYNIKVWQKQWPPLMRNTLDACIKHNASLVFFDNVYLYGADAVAHMTEESPVDPPSRKGAVRAEVAAMLMKEIEAGRIRGLIARSADFYGPNNQKSFLIETVYKNLKKGKAPNWFVNADKIHSFTFTPDAVRATALLGNTPDAYGQVWHLPTSPEKLTGRQIAQLFMDEMNCQKNMASFIRFLGFFNAFLREMPEMLYQYDRDYFFDSDKFTKRFGYGATTYKEGVQRTVRETQVGN